jgi:hypothetical protein
LIPLCHSGIRPEQLPVPINLSEGGVITDAKDLQKLYGRIAALLESHLPVVDFEEYANEFRGLELEYAKQRKSSVDGRSSPGRESINNPRVLCVSSPQFLELGFRNQIQLVLEAFPKHLEHAQVLNSADLRKLLTVERIDIVHVAAYVCPRSGELYFSEVDIRTGESQAPSDVLSAEAFASLLRTAGTRLAVISSCDSLALATSLLTVTNVIAPRDMISAKAMASWLETFYRTLHSQPLALAFDVASKVSGAPMLLYGQQPNVVFRSDETVQGSGPAYAGRP